MNLKQAKAKLNEIKNSSLSDSHRSMILDLCDIVEYLLDHYENLYSTPKELSLLTTEPPVTPVIPPSTSGQPFEYKPLPRKSRKGNAGDAK